MSYRFAKRIALLGGALALLSASFIGTVVAQEETTLRYFTFSAAPDYLEELDTIIAGFEEENPSVTIEVETAPFAD